MKRTETVPRNLCPVMIPESLHMLLKIKAAQEGKKIREIVEKAVLDVVFEKEKLVKEICADIRKKHPDRLMGETLPGEENPGGFFSRTLRRRPSKSKRSKK